MRRKAVLIAVVSALFASGIAVAASVAAARSGSRPSKSTSSSTSTSTSTSTQTSTSPVPSPPPGSTTTSTTPSPSPPPSALPDAADHYAVINLTVNAATDHEIAGTSAFPNFTTGAVDNYYTMSHSAVDNSPSAEGTASPADTGPIGQTVAAGNFSQPQYADARWPGNSGKATVGNQGGPYALADAEPFKATASATEASNGSSGSSGSSKATRISEPKGFSKRLRHALRLWKAKWLPRLHLEIPGLKPPPLKVRVLQSVGLPATPTVSVPGVSTPAVTTPTVSTPSLPTPPTKSRTGSHSKSHGSAKAASTPDGQSGLASSTDAELDSSGGDLTTNGESSLGSVSIGSGQIVLKGIDVSVQATNNGTPTDKISVDIADASVGGVPVTIDQDGVHVASQSQALPFQQADDALNGALKQAGVQLFTVAPEITKSKNEVTITASGVHLVFTQPVSPSGVPAQFAEHIFGEVFVDSLAVPGVPIGKLGNLGFGSSGAGRGGGSATTFSGGGSTGLASSGSTGYSSSAPSSSTGSTSQPASSLLSAITSKPLWFLLTYFLWQSVMIGTGASLWFWRMGGAAS
jgi:hypothetical protein